MKLAHVIFHEAIRDHQGRTSYTMPAANSSAHGDYQIELVERHGSAFVRLFAPGPHGKDFPHGFERLVPASACKEITPAVEPANYQDAVTSETQGTTSSPPVAPARAEGLFPVPKLAGAKR